LSQSGPINRSLVHRTMLIQAACTLEVLARKPGNSSPAKPLSSPGPEELLFCAGATAQVLALAPGRPLGQTILEGAVASRSVAATNANLGILLLLTPMAAVPDDQPIHLGIGPLIEATTVEDARLAYEAIRLMEPGGLGEAPDQDVHKSPSKSLVETMRLAQDRDFIAQLWSTGFARIFQEGLPSLGSGIQATGSIEASIILLFLHKLAQDGDTLIGRKFGSAINTEVSTRAAEVLARQWPLKQPGIDAYRSFDTWLRRNKYNPGTTADYVAAVVYAAFREGLLRLPLPFAWHAGMVC